MPFEEPHIEGLPRNRQSEAPAKRENSNLPAPRPYLPNDTLRNRLVALTNEKFSLQTISKASGRVFARAMTRLAMPVARRFALPGEKNPNIAAARQRLAAMPKGTKGLYRKDGAIIIAGQFGNLLKSAIEAGADLTDIHMVRADLSERYLDHINMRGGDFRLANMERIKLNGSDLTGADLRRTNLDRMRAKAIIAEGADFSESRMRDSRMNEGQLRAASFRGAILKAAEFKQADLRDADFTGVVFKCISTERATFRVEMDFADLAGARFSVDANFSNIKLTGTKNLDKVVIVGRDGQAIPGARLTGSGSIIYTEILPVPGQDASPRLPGPTG